MTDDVARILNIWRHLWHVVNKCQFHQLLLSMTEASANPTKNRVQRSRYQSHHFANFENLRICRTRPEPRPNSSGSVRVLHVHGFGSVRFEFYIFLHVSSSSVRFCQNVGSSSVRSVRFSSLVIDDVAEILPRCLILIKPKWLGYREVKKLW